MAVVASSVGLVTAAHTGHYPGHGRKGGRHNSVSWRLSPSPNSRAIAIRSRAGARISANLGVGGGDDAPAQQAVTRKSFPPGFVFGAGTSSYQIEGGWDEGGKGPSIWDHYCHTFPERIAMRHNGDVAVNSYHMYEDDVQMLKTMGMDAYRFSICWPRILPDGTLQGGINPEGIKYYNNLIDKLLENGIKPYVTLFHWETPQALDKAYGSFLDRKIVNDFRDYAEVCFRNFGDRVKHWFTFNEPYVFCNNAYSIGKHAPARCSADGGCAVAEGDSLVEPYTAGHHLLLAHAEAARLYKSKYQHLQEGQIGMALVSMGYEALDRTHHVHAQARERCIDHNLGWFLEPLFRGDYPFSMRSLIRERLPRFSPEEQTKLVGSYDMLGLNYYTSRFAAHLDYAPLHAPVLAAEDVYALPEKTGVDGEYIGENTGTDWLYSYPEGLKELLMIIRDRYGNPPIYITENGVGDIDEGNLLMEDALNDDVRLNYIKDHIAIVKESIDMGCKVRGHFTWSLIDNFEWQNGFTQRFGLIYVDHNDNFKRHMKKSAKWFADFNGAAAKDKRRRAVLTFPSNNGSLPTTPAAIAA